MKCIFINTNAIVNYIVININCNLCHITIAWDIKLPTRCGQLNQVQRGKLGQMLKPIRTGAKWVGL